MGDPFRPLHPFNIAAFRVLNPLGLLHYISVFGAEHLHPCGLRPAVSCLRFTPTVTRIDVKLGSDGRLTLSGWLFNQLDLSGFTWRTKDSLGGELNIQKGARRAVLRLSREHRFLPPPIPHLFLRLKASIPGVVRVTIKAIFVHGELRERIQDVSGGP
jgi:hypothetical protein